MAQYVAHAEETKKHIFSMDPKLRHLAVHVMWTCAPAKPITTSWHTSVIPGVDGVVIFAAGAAALSLSLSLSLSLFDSTAPLAAGVASPTNSASP